MTPKNSTPQIKNEKQYEALRDQGMSKQKAARIANTAKQDMDFNSRAYEARTKKDLYQKVKEVGIAGRSKMTKNELIEALRNN
ncbi:Rho termination factor [Algoriphagus sp.]|uniref:DUF7218 family protein n=1 Tax=Algoriphagus sp. TaxID=1872435 RepID=UPI002632E8CA|nr:Rho termination factor [Algoriphagus sp.]